MRSGKLASIGFALVTGLALSASAKADEAAAGGSDVVCPVCGADQVEVNHGTVTKSSAEQTAANETAACNLAKMDAQNLAFFEISRIRDEECIDGAQGGTAFNTLPMSTSGCACITNADMTVTCTAGAAQEWICCKPKPIFGH